ncbi:unnamed protein product [Boreogadus saida]
MAMDSVADTPRWSAAKGVPGTVPRHRLFKRYNALCTCRAVSADRPPERCLYTRRRVPDAARVATAGPPRAGVSRNRETQTRVSDVFTPLLGLQTLGNPPIVLWAHLGRPGSGATDTPKRDASLRKG